MEQRRPTRSDADTLIVPPDCMPLGIASRGFCGRIHVIHVSDGTSGLPAIELERRLLELGFIEGADVAVLHEGPVGRQKVANYPGVTVERKAGVFRTPSGYTVRLIDLPGTYSLRGRSPDEEITRDVVLGRLASEQPPGLIVCVTDATNLRVSLRLVLELKRVGRPLMLVLNMIDIARRRGMEIDLARLSAELGVPVVTSNAVRRGGTDELLSSLDRVAAGELAPSGENRWEPLTPAELRAAQREADRVVAASVVMPARPGTLRGR